jgi:hypothetical protein
VRADQLDVAWAQVKDFLDARAGVEHGGEEGVVAASVEGGTVHGPEDCLDFVVLEILHRAGARPLEGHGEDPLALLKSIGVAGGDVAEERVDGGETDVAGPRAILAFGLQMVEEVQDLAWAEMIDVDLRHPASAAGSNEAEEEDQAVAVALHGVRAEAAYPRQVVGEEIADGAGQGVGQRRLHGLPPGREDAVMSVPQWRAKRSLAALASASTNGR